MKVTLSATWLRQPWPMTVWDMAYSYIVKAGTGDEKAKKELENIKVAAQAGNAQAIPVQRNFDAVAQLILKGLPKPSEFVRSRRRASPLLPGGVVQTRAQAAQAAQAAAKLKQSKDVMRRTVTQQTQQLARQRAAEQARMARSATARGAAEARINVRRTEQERYQDELDTVRKQLENRDIADDKRKALEDLANQYEALLEKTAIPEAAKEPINAVTPEGSEALADDAAEAYPSGAPGDVEFNDGGM